MEDKAEKHYLEEEKPLIELPALIWSAIVTASLLLGLFILKFPPVISILIFVGIGFAIAILLNPFVGIIVFLIGAYFKPIAYLPMLREYHPATVAAVVVALIYGLHIIVYRDFTFIKAKQIFIMIGFTSMFVISTLYHYDAPEIMFEFLHFIQVIILYFLVINLVKTERQIYILSFCLIAIGVATASTAFYNHLHGYGEVVTGGVARTAIFEGNPNYLALSLVMVIPLILGFMFNLKNIMSKLILLLVVLCCILAIIFTFSRSGALGLVAVLILSAFSFVKKQSMIIVVLLLVAIFTTSLVFIPPQYWERISTITKVKDFSATSRLGVYKVSTQIMLAHPFAGIGMSIPRFKEEYFERAQHERNVTALAMEWAHNMFLEIGSKLGLIAMLFLIWLIVQVFIDCSKTQRLLKEENKDLLVVISNSLRIGLIGCIIIGLFADAVYEKIFWIYCGLTMVLANIAAQTKQRATE